MDSQYPPPSPTSVAGMNIFWTIFGLSLACSLHPLGSALGFSPSLTRYIRVLPVCSALDVLFFLYECFLVSYQSSSSGEGWLFLQPVVDLATSRCRDTLGLRPPQDVEQHTLQVEDPDQEESALVLALAFIALGIRSRLFLYAKMCGYHGVPRSFVIASIYFGSWVLMEAFLLIAYGFRVMPHSRVRDAFGAIFPRNVAVTTVGAASGSGAGGTAAAAAAAAATNAVPPSRSRQSPTQKLFRLLGTLAIIAQVLEVSSWALQALARRLSDDVFFSSMVYGFANAFVPKFRFCEKIMELGSWIMNHPGKLSILYLPAVLFWGALFLLELPVCTPYPFLSMVAIVVVVGALGAFFQCAPVNQARVWTVALLVGLALSCTVWWDPTGTVKEPWTENLG